MVIWRDGLFKNGFFSILIALTIIFSIGFVLSVHLISPTSITVNQSQNYVYNITVNNTNVCPVGGNITQLNMTLPGGFVFITDTNGTSTVGGFVNTSSVLSWTNTTYYLINCSTNNTAFWFNATANSTAGSYNITVTSVNASAIYSTNVSITVNDITPPSSITFISQTPATSSNLSSSSIAVNLTANDDVGIGTFRIYLWNSTGVNNTNISSSGTTGYAYINFTGLADGVYYLNTTVNDSSGNENRTSETRRITLDTRAPVITSVVGSGGVNSTSARITWDTNESANSIVYYGTSTGTGSSKSGDGSYGTFQTVYLTGLSASTLYYYNASSCDFAGNCNISIQANFTTSATPSTDSGSPGGGSSTPTTQTWKYTYPNNNAELSVKGTVVQGMYLKERTQLKVSGEAHYVGIVGLTSTQATINVSSTSQQAVFNIGDSKRFEVTNDNFYDLKVVLVGIKDNKANVTIEYIHEAMPASAAPAANTTANNNANVTNTLTSNQQKASAWYSNLTFNSKIIYGIVIGLLVILGIVGIVYYIIKQRKMQGY